MEVQMEERKMSHEVFGQLLDELDGDGKEVLKEKNARYSAPDDALHNFRAGANFTGLTAAQTCWGYMSKHLIALKDMIDRNDFSNREDFMEKCKDPINYLRILWAIGNDEEYWKGQERPVACEGENVKGLPKAVTVYLDGKVCNFFNNADKVISDERGFTVYLDDPYGLPWRFNYEINNYTYKISERKDK